MDFVPLEKRTLVNLLTMVNKAVFGKNTEFVDRSKEIFNASVIVNRETSGKIRALNGASDSAGAAF